MRAWCEGKPGIAMPTGIPTDSKVAAADYVDDFTTLPLARYNANGTPDTTFSDDGKTTTNLFDAYFLVDDAAIQADGRIVLSGEGSGSGYYSAARFDVDGALDSTFGTEGFAVTDFSPFYDVAYAVAIQNDGKIVTAGTAEATYFASRDTSGREERFLIPKSRTEPDRERR